MPLVSRQVLHPSPRGKELPTAYVWSWWMQAPGAHLMVVDKATERGVLRKLDYRIVPMVMWVYLMNMMDRGEFCS